MYHPRFTGNHYDSGLKYGNILKKNHITLLGLTKLDDFQLEYGIQSAKIVNTYFPDACEEMRGIAEGLGLPYQRFSAWLMCVSVCLDFQGCSMIALKHNGRVVFGRNNDLPPTFGKISNSALYAPSHGYAFLANSSAFVGAEDGINEHGLAAGMTYVWAKDLKPGMNSMFFVRYILETCATVAEGLSAIQRIPIGGAYHLIVADHSDIAHVECSPQRIRIHRGDVAAASNHFVSDDMKVHEETKDLYRSYERYKTASTALSRPVDSDPVDYAKAILSGKPGFMCQYDKTLNFDTIWSSVFDLSTQKIYRAEGNPSRCSFKEDARCKRFFTSRS